MFDLKNSSSLEDQSNDLIVEKFGIERCRRTFKVCESRTLWHKKKLLMN
jgi:hypothetical protein